MKLKIIITVLILFLLGCATTVKSQSIEIGYNIHKLSYTDKNDTINNETYINAEFKKTSISSKFRQKVAARDPAKNDYLVSTQVDRIFGNFKPSFSYGSIYFDNGEREHSFKPGLMVINKNIDYGFAFMLKRIYPVNKTEYQPIVNITFSPNSKWNFDGKLGFFVGKRHWSPNLTINHIIEKNNRMFFEGGLSRYGSHVLESKDAIENFYISHGYDVFINKSLNIFSKVSYFRDNDFGKGMNLTFGFKYKFQ